ncbi:MAG: MAPEG family protein [Steroidobacteraceae bacterium]|jgi:uncharacterized MAPEG superfamily protein
MTTALWVLLVTLLLPIVCAGLSKAGGPDRYDNANPREWLARRTGRQARANAAQANSWEALAGYVAGLLAAFIGGADPAAIATVALIFLAARIAYIACYVADLATLRSIVWLVGFGSCICLVVMGARAA